MLGEISIVSFSQLPSLKILKSHSRVIPPLLLALIFPFLFQNGFLSTIASFLFLQSPPSSGNEHGMPGRLFQQMSKYLLANYSESSCMYLPLHFQIKHRIYFVIPLSKTYCASPECAELYPVGFQGTPLHHFSFYLKSSLPLSIHINPFLTGLLPRPQMIPCNLGSSSHTICFPFPAPFHASPLT